jgi:hypothetical protein
MQMLLLVAVAAILGNAAGFQLAGRSVRQTQQLQMCEPKAPPKRDTMPTPSVMMGNEQ